MKIAKKSTAEIPLVSTLLLIAIACVAVIWSWQCLAMISRSYLLVPYIVMHPITPSLEPFAGSYFGTTAIITGIASWLALYWRILHRTPQADLRPLIYLSISCLSFIPFLLRLLEYSFNPPTAWEPIWASAWTGLSFGSLAHYATRIQRIRHTAAPENQVKHYRYSIAVLVFISLASALWWYVQSIQYYQNFLLGYNDFGHFLQRVANTAQGRGLLLESPVLPAFWDHFNPGLLALVPLWKVFPSVALVFSIQAFSLAGSSLFIFFIARRLEHSHAASLAFALAWLAQPVVGQMNLAYTYGWHPITCAIPMLLAALLALLHKRYLLAVLATLGAMSCEEGVIAVVALFAATCCLLSYWKRRRTRANGDSWDALDEHLTVISPLIWGTVAVASVISFWIVYRYSGLAEFQTGRFVSLGNTPLEIVLSPYLRPAAFWGQLFQLENLVFLALIWLPCGLANLWHGWRWLLPTLLPLGLLLVWGHRPAQCIAFQYTSALLPIFWLAATAGASKPHDQIAHSAPVIRSLPSGITALVTGLMLSVFYGQFPFSCNTLLDITATTYKSYTMRKSDSEDGIWLRGRVAKLRKSGEECLATGRIAAHLIGVRDLETVGQYKERRDKLNQLPDRAGEPIKHYQWIVLDRREVFQQTWIQTVEVETEALESGFVVVEDKHDIVVLRNINKSRQSQAAAP